jgi:hypothetical protein
VIGVEAVKGYEGPASHGMRPESPSKKQSRDITRVNMAWADMSCFVALVGLLVGPLPRRPFLLGPAMTSEFLHS